MSPCSCQLALLPSANVTMDGPTSVFLTPHALVARLVSPWILQETVSCPLRTLVVLPMIHAQPNQTRFVSSRLLAVLLAFALRDITGTSMASALRKPPFALIPLLATWELAATQLHSILDSSASATKVGLTLSSQTPTALSPLSSAQLALLATQPSVS